MNNEVWKPVVGYEGFYEVSNYGRVRSYYVRGHTKTRTEPRILRPGNVRGYQQVLLRKNCASKSGLVHRLVAEAFLGAPPSPEHQVNHKDLNKANNVPDNLEWVTHVENILHAAPLLPRNRGEANHSKLRERDVRYIRERYASGQITLTDLARMFYVSTPTIHAIVRRQKWKHVA